MRAENNKRQAHIINARQRLYDLFAKLDCRERPIFTVKSGGAQATTHLSSPEHPSESFRREVRVANSVLRANDHRDVYNKTGAVFLQPLFHLILRLSKPFFKFLRRKRLIKIESLYHAAAGFF